MERRGVDMGIHTVVQIGDPFRDGDARLTGSDGQAHAADITAGGFIWQIVIQNAANLIQFRCPVRPGRRGVFHRGVGRGQNGGQHRIGVLYPLVAALRFRDLVVEFLSFRQRRAGFLLGGGRFVQSGFQFSVVGVRQPRFMSQTPGIAGRNHATAIQRIDGIDKRLGLGAERRFGCGRCLRSGCHCGFLRRCGFCKGKRAAQVAERQNACQQQRQPPFPEFRKMV